MRSRARSPFAARRYRSRCIVRSSARRSAPGGAACGPSGTGWQHRRRSRPDRRRLNRHRSPGRRRSAAVSTSAATISRRSSVARISHTRATINGNSPPALWSTMTITAAQANDHRKNGTGPTCTPPATSAHGTSPSTAARTVVPTTRRSRRSPRARRPPRSTPARAWSAAPPPRRARCRPPCRPPYAASRRRSRDHRTVPTGPSSRRPGIHPSSGTGRRTDRGPMPTTAAGRTIGARPPSPGGDAHQEVTMLTRLGHFTVRRRRLVLSFTVLFMLVGAVIGTRPRSVCSRAAGSRTRPRKAPGRATAQW